MINSVGDVCKVTVETPDGQVIDLTGYMVELDVESGLVDYDYDNNGQRLFLPTSYEVTMTIKGTGATITDHNTFLRKVEDDRRRSVWRCPYCNTENDDDVVHCGAGLSYAAGCGAPKPLLLSL